uniref:SEA domain-containing protein n=1 Tax=Eptatretus burgeri TaxID=7764 RepID=A0A8C4Q8R1_EPTBU
MFAMELVGRDGAGLRPSRAFPLHLSASCLLLVCSVQLSLQVSSSTLEMTVTSENVRTTTEQVISIPSTPFDKTTREHTAENTVTVSSSSSQHSTIKSQPASSTLQSSSSIVPSLHTTPIFTSFETMESTSSTTLLSDQTSSLSSRYSETSAQDTISTSNMPSSSSTPTSTSSVQVEHSTGESYVTPSTITVNPSTDWQMENISTTEYSSLTLSSTSVAPTETETISVNTSNLDSETTTLTTDEVKTDGAATSDTFFTTSSISTSGFSLGSSTEPNVSTRSATSLSASTDSSIATEASTDSQMFSTSSSSTEDQKSTGLFGKVSTTVENISPALTMRSSTAEGLGTTLESTQEMSISTSTVDDELLSSSSSRNTQAASSMPASTLLVVSTDGTSPVSDSKTKTSMEVSSIGTPTTETISSMGTSIKESTGTSDVSSTLTTLLSPIFSIQTSTVGDESTAITSEVTDSLHSPATAEINVTDNVVSDPTDHVQTSRMSPTVESTSSEKQQTSLTVLPPTNTHTVDTTSIATAKDTPSTAAAMATFDLLFKITSTTFTSSLNDSSSEDYKNFTKTIEKSINEIYSSFYDFRANKVTRLWAGSINVDTLLYFDGVVSETAVNDQFLKNTYSGTKLGNYTVDPTSIQVKYVPQSGTTGASASTSITTGLPPWPTVSPFPPWAVALVVVTAVSLFLNIVLFITLVVYLIRHYKYNVYNSSYNPSEHHKSYPMYSTSSTLHKDRISFPELYENGATALSYTSLQNDSTL